MPYLGLFSLKNFGFLKINDQCFKVYSNFLDKTKGDLFDCDDDAKNCKKREPKPWLKGCVWYRRRLGIKKK